MASIWRAWEALRRYLILSQTSNQLPDHWRIEEVLNHLQPYANMGKETLKILVFLFGKIGVTIIGHLWNNTDNTWKTFTEKLKRTRGIPHDLKELAAAVLEDLQEASTVVTEKDTDPDLWRWVDGTPTNGTFQMNNQQTYRTLLSKSEE